MIKFKFGYETHDIEVTWAVASRINDRVGDPHLILASGGDMGLIKAVRIVSIATGIPEVELGEHAMKKGARDVYSCASEILLATIPQEDDIPETDEGKKT